MKLLLIHDEMLNTTLPVFESHPNLERVFVFDPGFIADQGWQLRRLQFIADALTSIPDVRVFKGSLADVLASLEATQVVTQATPNTEILAWLATLSFVQLEFVAAPEFVTHTGSVARFSKYWSSAQSQWFPTTQA